MVIVEMCSELKLLNEISLQRKTYASDGIVTSEDDQYCVVVEDGFYIFQLCGFLENFMKTMSFTKQFVKVSNYAISSDLGIDINSFITSLSKYKLYEAILRLDLSEELNNCSVNKQQVLLAKWSPTGLVANRCCILGILNHTGGLILLHSSNEGEYESFIEVANISKICLEYLKNKYFHDNFDITYGDNFAELKRRTSIATPNIFVWSHTLTEDGRKFCIIIVGHLDGGITVCRVNVESMSNDCVECTVIGYCQTGMKQLTAMHWQRADGSGLLIIGDLAGKVTAISITNIHWDSIVFEDPIHLWSQTDNLKVNFVKGIVYDRNSYVFIVKETVLLLCLINKTGKILDIHSYQFGNILITGIEHYEENIILVLTYTGMLKEIKFNYTNGKVQLRVRNIFIDFKWWTHSTHGLVVSKNKVFIGILASLSKLTNIRKRKDHVRLLIFMNTAKNPLETLLSNKTNLITTYWDCFEVIRINAVLEKKLLIDELPKELDYDKLSLVQLKTCFWLAKCSEVMQEKTQIIKRNDLIKYDEIKYILKLKLSIEHARHLLKIISKGEQLSEFHMQSLDIINLFLKESVSNGTVHKLGLGKATIDKLYEVIRFANELVYPKPLKCVWCEERLLCTPPHPDMRCQVSFMPVTTVPFYKCEYCKCVVHEKLSELYKVVLCQYCDIPLKYIRSLNDNISHLRNENNGTSVQEFSCYSDCLKRNIDVGEFEDYSFSDFNNDGFETLSILFEHDQM